jgi:aminopeptidase N
MNNTDQNTYLLTIIKIIMQNNNKCEINNFGPIGSYKHEIPNFNFSIDYMNLKVEPFFESKTIECEQQLKITAKENIGNIELDSAGLIIKSIILSNIDTSSKSKDNGSSKEIISFETTDDNKLKISFEIEIPASTSFDITIKYSTQPKTGFHFIEPDKYYPQKTLHAWTQGEPEDSKYWFPCIDKPQIKFPREISVKIPAEFLVISNGIQIEQSEIESIGNKIDNKNKIMYTWREETPDSTYLTSIAIGKFAKKESKVDKVDLVYCVPENKGEYAMISFSDTPNMIKVFENYLNTDFPYKKYAQIVVEDFDYGGMENTSCTTLYEDALANQKLLRDPTDDYVNRNNVIAHELAHQWFGDLVTCKDWSHIWLNEGFATFFEALYWEHKTRNYDQYQAYILKSARAYFAEACKSWTRPIVYNYYLDPLDLFDDHSYLKGGCILHMIRNYIGDENFRKSLKTYLQKYRYKSVETNDLIQTLEEVTQQDLKKFINQWVYGAGHPELFIEYSFDQSIIKIKITQKQEAKREYDIDTFKFPLDIKLVYSFGNNEDRETKIYRIEISEKETEAKFQIPINGKGQSGKLEWFSIDPYFKILKEIIYINSSKEMLLKQLRWGETVYERTQAIESLKNLINISPKEFKIDIDIITALQNSILKDSFYSVSVEAAELLGMYTSSDDAYQFLRKCIYSTEDQKIKSQIINSISNFEKEDEELLEKFIQILKDDKESYNVQSSAATAIGAKINKTKNSQKYISILKDVVNTHNSIFKEHVAYGAIEGLGHISNNEDNHILSDIIDFLIDNSDYKSGNTNLIRERSTVGLGNFLLHQIKDNNKKEVNYKVFNHLEYSLHDKWYRTRKSAIAGLVTAFSGEKSIGLSSEDIERVLEMFEDVSKIDIHAEVRESADSAIETIKKSQTDPLKAEDNKLHVLKRITRGSLFYKEWHR